MRSPANVAKSFDSPAGHQQPRPRAVSQAADLNSRVTVGRVVNKPPVADKHSRMRDVIAIAAKEEQIAGAQLSSTYRRDPSPCSLQVRVTRHNNPAAANQHLSEP